MSDQSATGAAVPPPAVGLQSVRDRERQDEVDEKNLKLREKRRHEREEDSTPIFLQLHYATSFDRSGYPELRQEFVDFLEEALDRSLQKEKLKSFDMRGYYHKAQRHVEADQPGLYEYYSLRDIHGMSYHAIYDLTSTRQSVATRYVNQIRRAIDYWYKKFLIEDGKLPS